MIYKSYTKDGMYDQVTICPWFLDYWTKKDKKTMEEIGHGDSANLVVFSRAITLPALVTFFKYTLIDKLSSFEKILLHEVRSNQSLCGRRWRVGLCLRHP
jgi:hypothetical protein